MQNELTFAAGLDEWVPRGLQRFSHPAVKRRAP